MTPIEVELEDTDAKGRNGWFRVVTAAVTTGLSRPLFVKKGELRPVIRVEFWSKVKGKEGPTVLEMPYKDAKVLIETVGEIVYRELK